MWEVAGGVMEAVGEASGSCGEGDGESGGEDVSEGKREGDGEGGGGGGGTRSLAIRMAASATRGATTHHTKVGMAERIWALAKRWSCRQATVVRHITAITRRIVSAAGDSGGGGRGDVNGGEVAGNDDEGSEGAGTMANVAPVEAPAANKVMTSEAKAGMGGGTSALTVRWR